MTEPEYTEIPHLAEPETEDLNDADLDNVAGGVAMTFDHIKRDMEYPAGTVHTMHTIQTS